MGGADAVRARLPRGYGDIAPVANYCPWDSDEEFGVIWDTIVASTKLDKMRGYTLWRLVGSCLLLGGDVLEVGAWRGGSGALLCERAERAAGSAHTYLADTFRGVVKAGIHDTYYKGGEHADACPGDVADTFRTLNLSDWTILEGVFPDDTGAKIGDRRFCFCHIDVDVYQSAADAMEWVWPRLAVGGAVVFDDYGFWGCEGVTKLGNEEYAQFDRHFIYNVTGQGIVIKLGR